MECMQLRSPPGPFHYLISEQAKSLVALQELQNEVGALLEFRDLVIETFPNLRSKMAPSMPAVARRDWEPGVRVRRKLAGASDTTRTKPQPSVQDSGFSTETSCGKDAHSSASASRSRPAEDELWALLDVIQRKGLRLRDEAELLRGELDADTAEESFARVLSASECACSEARRLRSERDELLQRAAELEASALLVRAAPPSPRTPLGRLDRVLATPARPPRVPTPDPNKFAAILQESNPVELQRQLLTSTVKAQVMLEQLKKAATQHSLLKEQLARSRDDNDDLRFQLEEKTIELEGARAKVRQLESRQRTPTSDAECPSRQRERDSMHSRSQRDRDSMRDSRSQRERDSMRDLEPVTIPDEEARISETPRRRPSRIPLHTAAAAARARRDSASSPPPRPPSAHSARSAASARSRKKTSAVPVRCPPNTDKRHRPAAADTQQNGGGASYHDSLNFVTTRRESETELISEYLARTDRLLDHRLLGPRLLDHRLTDHPLPPPRARPLPADLAFQQYDSPQNLALELSKSILYEDANSIDVKTLKSLNSHGDSKQYSEDSLWNGRPQKYFESMKYGEHLDADDCAKPAQLYDHDSLAI
ncbi:uncharacterized protein LOC105383292 isoform X3 [Plutella xylostella]|nr:uncharacterized protein LOC105383292 isoform X3 [Plutella xylostella]